jgi:hypothetical protein
MISVTLDSPYQVKPAVSAIIRANLQVDQTS